MQHEPLGFHDYNHLQMNAFAVVSDSGTLPEESSFFTSIGHPIPAVCIRTSTERPEALDKACFVLAGIDKNRYFRQWILLCRCIWTVIMVFQCRIIRRKMSAQKWLKLSKVTQEW